MFTVIVAAAKEFSLLKAESPAPKIEQTPLGWPPLELEEASQPITEPKSEVPSFTVSASVYFPEPAQTDDTPYITADGSRINKRNPGKHRWIAVSRDLHSRWGGNINYGDSLWVTGISDQLDGLYVVRDVMNRRMRKRIDILVGKHDEVMGFWKNVQIAKLD
ncbi:hypothetical protein [Pontibacter ummariensis]|nr:hypothetical protein [Pontibacter ummariensis]